jgi:4a-hydroxytetrahydrobiopterin dehydratase
MDLLSKKCVPCEGGMPPMTEEEANKYLSETLGWKLADDKKSISRDFEFKDFKESMDFVNHIAGIVNEEGHHPDIYIFYNKVQLALSTHAIGGLSENDFILAAKINHLPLPRV